MKVVFIINNAEGSHFAHRLNEFIDNGYEVLAYGFSRVDLEKLPENNSRIEIIGEFLNTTSYFKRIFIILKSLRKMFRSHDFKDCIFYLCGLDMALPSMIFKKSRRRYIYEECDLAQAHVSNKILRYLLDLIDNRIINGAKLTVLTSEGFLQYHYSRGLKKTKTSIEIIPNKLSSLVSGRNTKFEKHDIKRLRIGFVGTARYNSIAHFADIFSSSFPNSEFHFFGTIVSNFEEFNRLKERNNVFFHGPFKNPVDLDSIYSRIDMVLCTYDLSSDNVKFAEPNKLYEAIYFATPIIVTRGTFLAEKVDKLGVGYSIDPLDDNLVIDFINSIESESFYDRVINCVNIPSKELVSDNSIFFEKIKAIFKVV
jgi:succinoglycan biosynthesis protein ExoL